MNDRYVELDRRFVEMEERLRRMSLKMETLQRENEVLEKLSLKVVKIKDGKGSVIRNPRVKLGHPRAQRVNEVAPHQA